MNTLNIDGLQEIDKDDILEAKDIMERAIEHCDCTENSEDYEKVLNLLEKLTNN